MSDDEVFVLAASAIGCLVFGWRWYGGLLRVQHLGRDRSAVWTPLAISPILCLASVLAVICAAADPVVRNDVRYIMLFVFSGGVYLAAATFGLACLGISARDDALENCNTAAAWAVCGAQAGAAACFAGSNVGVGPTIWTTLIPAFFAGMTLIVAVFLVAVLTSLSDDVAIDRDVASGLRMAGCMAACGLVLGRAAAGDFESWRSTFIDFAKMSWPVGGFVAATIMLQVKFCPNPRVLNPSPWTFGALPAAGMIALAIGLIFAYTLDA